MAQMHRTLGFGRLAEKALRVRRHGTGARPRPDPAHPVLSEGVAVVDKRNPIHVGNGGAGRTQVRS